MAEQVTLRVLADPAARRVAGRLAARLFVAAGSLTILNDFIPPVDHLDRRVLFAVGVSAILFGVLSALAPWERWPAWTTLTIAPVAFVHIAAANFFGGVSAYSYAVYFVLVFVYVGMTHPPRTSIRMAPIAVLAYVAPALLDATRPALAAMSATVAIPICVIVGESLSRRTAQLHVARERAGRQSAVLNAIARASRSIYSLNHERVLQNVVSTAVGMGFESAEICVFEPHAGTWRSAFPLGLPDSYAGTGAITEGIAGRVWSTRDTVVVPDYSSLPDGVPELQHDGYHVVIAAPIRCRGALAAALIAGTRARPALGQDDVEAFELLADQAGHALENARRFEEEQDTVRKLADLDRLKGVFISNVSHELRTPLTVIRGMGDTLDERWTTLDEPVKRDLLGRMNTNAQVLDGIIANLLDFARLEGGHVQVHAEEVDVGLLLRSAAARLSGLFEGHEIRMQAPPGYVVSADRQLLERVIENLLSNAVRHTPPGTMVDVEASADGDCVVVSVADDGPGIPPHELSHIGERFYRGGPPDRGPNRGTGLGLAFVTELLSLHGTKLEVSSSRGRGARFSFALTLVKQDAIAQRAQPA